MTTGQVRKFRLLFLALIPIIVLFPRGGSGGETGLRVWPSVVSGIFPQSMETYVRSNLPFQEHLRKLAVSLRYAGGSREQNGVFICGDTLIKNIDQPTAGVVERNNEAVLEFARYLRGGDIPFYFTLIPTASGVLRQSMPAYAHVFDQRRLIDDIYSEMTGKLVTVDSYLPLSTNRGQYLYLRTENNLTAYGGYYVYAALAKRLGATETPSYSAYDISYSGNQYRGDLYELSPYTSVSPDVLILFRYSRYAREYTVTHTGPEGSKMYHTLYPEHLRDMGNPMSVYLGGISCVTEIKTSAPYDRSLLVFGDKTAAAYLPFLVNHYRQITLVDLFQDAALFRDIDPNAYDQVLMAYSVETYISPPSTPARVTLFVDE